MEEPARRGAGARVRTRLLTLQARSPVPVALIRKSCNCVIVTDSKKRWTVTEVSAWFAGRLPDSWFAGAPEVTADREEVLVVGVLPDPELGPDTDADALEVARRSRIRGFREDTRAQRMRVADEAEILWGRKVSWGATCGDVRELFTTQSVPVMSRLRMNERAVLDTLIDAGVARSRSEALAWCVRLVGQHQSDWITQLRDAVAHVERVRAGGPDREATDDQPADGADT
jgi:hypothetical protein